MNENARVFVSSNTSVRIRRAFVSIEERREYLKCVYLLFFGRCKMALLLTVLSAPLQEISFYFV